MTTLTYTEIKRLQTPDRFLVITSATLSSQHKWLGEHKWTYHNFHDSEEIGQLMGGN